MSTGQTPEQRRRTERRQMEVEILRRRWSWLGHKLRKPANNITQQALTWTQQGKRKRETTKHVAPRPGLRCKTDRENMGTTGADSTGGQSMAYAPEGGGAKGQSKVKYFIHKL